MFSRSNAAFKVTTAAALDQTGFSGPLMFSSLAAEVVNHACQLHLVSQETQGTLKHSSLVTV